MNPQTSKSSSETIRYWLFKSEPNVYSIDDLARDKNQTTCWDGIRNYQARNFLRDDIRVGDKVFFYHSRVNPMAVVGTMKVVKAGYPDHTAFDSNGKYFDPKSTPEDPTWYLVDVQLIQKFPKPLTRAELKSHPELADMLLLKRGSRLSIQPVTQQEWKFIHHLADVPEK